MPTLIHSRFPFFFFPPSTRRLASSHDARAEPQRHILHHPRAHSDWSELGPDVCRSQLIVFRGRSPCIMSAERDILQLVGRFRRPLASQARVDDFGFLLRCNASASDPGLAVCKHRACLARKPRLLIIRHAIDTVQVYDWLLTCVSPFLGFTLASLSFCIYRLDQEYRLV